MRLTVLKAVHIFWAVLMVFFWLDILFSYGLFPAGSLSSLLLTCFTFVLFLLDQKYWPEREFGPVVKIVILLMAAALFIRAVWNMFS
ncbi:MAG: hypothetical protein Q4C72_04850 [Eubacteriales bacterium]|nr:hypothetical protein [Eubacteriales bacterium]